MKRISLFLLAASVAFTAGPASAEQAEHGEHPAHTHMEEMMKKGGGPEPDDRRALELPEQMKVMQKRMMMDHLDTVGEIAAALGGGDLKGAAKTAKGKLGWSEEEEKKCSTVADIAGEEEFLSLGMAVHRKADELAEAAEKGDRDKAMMKLSELVLACNACHRVLRH